MSGSVGYRLACLGVNEFATLDDYRAVAREAYAEAERLRDDAHTIAGDAETAEKLLARSDQLHAAAREIEAAGDATPDGQLARLAQDTSELVERAEYIQEREAERAIEINRQYEWHADGSATRLPEVTGRCDYDFLDHDCGYCQEDDVCPDTQEPEFVPTVGADAATWTVGDTAADGTMKELSSEEIDAILADPCMAGSEAEHAYYWENGGVFPGHERELPDGAEPPAEIDHHHLWLSGMGDPQLDEHLAEDPDDAAAVARVRAERAERCLQQQADIDEL